MKLKDSYLKEKRQTQLFGILSEIKKMPFIQKIIKSHYLADGIAVFARTTDGNAYEFIVRPAEHSKYFKDLR